MAVYLPTRQDAAKAARRVRAAAARRRAMVAGRVYRPMFTAAQLRALSMYANRGADLSITYKYVMGPFYDRAVRWLPLWLAPNTVTLIGFLLILVSHGFLMYYAPRLDKPAPSWVYINAGLSLFMYMVLDNIDGRQARRTSSSSPLGHLFDHGCDAFNVTISGVSFLATQQIGPTFWSYLFLFCSGHLICYTASLEEYFTGAMILRQVNGPNEGLILMSLLYIATGIFGPGIWTGSCCILGLSLTRGKWFGIFMNIPGLITVYGNFRAIWMHGSRQKIDRFRRESLRALVNFVVFSLSLFAWSVIAPESYARGLPLILWMSCLNFFYLISRMIICHLTQAEYPTFLKMLIPQIICSVNAVVGQLIMGRPLVSQAFVLSLTFIFTALFNFWRIYCMITQICEYLNIQCFRLGPLRVDDGRALHGEDGQLDLLPGELKKKT